MSEIARGYTRRAVIVALAAVQVAIDRKAWAEAQLSAEFQRELKGGRFVFDNSLFADFEPVRILANPHMDYEHAVRHRSIPLEIRFALRSFGELRNESDFRVGAEAVVRNITAKSDTAQDQIRMSAFDVNAVREEFNADFGLSAAFTPDPTFARYTAGLCVVIGRTRRVASGYIIYLFNSTAGGWSEETEKAVEHTFHALRFGDF
jgi:hypothetical protein